MLSVLSLVLGLMGTFAVGAALLWTRSRWRSRGRLKVPIFPDRLSRNACYGAGGILVTSIILMVGINLALVVSGSASLVAPSFLPVPFVLAAVLVSLADVEGLYGTGIYVRNPDRLVRLDWADVTPGRDTLQILHGGALRNWYFLGTRQARKTIEDITRFPAP